MEVTVHSPVQVEDSYEVYFEVHCPQEYDCSCGMTVTDSVMVVVQTSPGVRVGSSHGQTVVVRVCVTGAGGGGGGGGGEPAGQVPVGLTGETGLDGQGVDDGGTEEELDG